MGYGPGFRLMKTSFRKGPPATGELGAVDGLKACGMASLTIKEDHDDWEEYCTYHAGIYDCALQAGAPRGYDERIAASITRREPGNHRHPDRAGPDEPHR